MIAELTPDTSDLIPTAIAAIIALLWARTGRSASKLRGGLRIMREAVDILERKTDTGDAQINDLADRLVELMKQPELTAVVDQAMIRAHDRAGIPVPQAVRNWYKMDRKEAAGSGGDDPAARTTG